MAVFIPQTNTAGSFTNQGQGGAVIDSTYGGLGGTYGAIHYGYGGFVQSLNKQSSTTGSFTPSAT